MHGWILHMPFANNSGNCHDYVDEEQLVSGCRKSSKLRVRLYMRDCFRAQTFDSDYVYVDEWPLPNATPTFITSQNLLEKDVSTFMRRSPKGVLLVHVDEHRPMCPDPDLRRGIHESTCRACCGPGLGNLRWHSTPAQAEVVRNFPTTDRMFASRCGDNHEGAPIHGRHRRGQCGNSASCGNIACDTWTCLVEAPPCRLALSI